MSSRAPGFIFAGRRTRRDRRWTVGRRNRSELAVRLLLIAGLLAVAAVILLVVLAR